MEQELGCQKNKLGCIDVQNDLMINCLDWTRHLAPFIWGSKIRTKGIDFISLQLIFFSATNV